MQHGCEKTNVEYELSIQRGFESVCCSKTDLSKIFEYFGKTLVIPGISVTQCPFKKDKIKFSVLYFQ